MSLSPNQIIRQFGHSISSKSSILVKVRDNQRTSVRNLYTGQQKVNVLEEEEEQSLRKLNLLDDCSCLQVNAKNTCYTTYHCNLYHCILYLFFFIFIIAFVNLSL
ncbi:unnamed protein product [Schistosoma haematobium]|nr:unnamed protein product [Schistosoma haematobium]